MATKRVILVDENGKEVGTEDKLKAHKDGGKLHSAFSIFVFNSDGKLMLQKRAKKKYHFGGLWTNTCCSHPIPDKSLLESAHIRLKEEMGFDTDLEKIFDFIYKATWENGLTEHEFDNVIIGHYDEKPNPNPKEVDDWKWIDPKTLKKDIKQNPEKYSPWFKKSLPKVLDYIDKE